MLAGYGARHPSACPASPIYPASARGDHQRSWAWHQVITDPEPRAASALRRRWVGMLRPVGPEPEVQRRSLGVYDALLGTGGDGGGAA